MNRKSNSNRIKNTFQSLEQYGKADLYWRRVVCYFKQRNEPNQMSESEREKKSLKVLSFCDFTKCKKQNDGKEMKNHLDLITIMLRENVILTGAEQVAVTATTTPLKSIRKKNSFTTRRNNNKNLAEKKRICIVSH